MDNRCIVCGEIIPEGRQVCPKCEKGKQYDLDLVVDSSHNRGRCDRRTADRDHERK